MIARSSKSRKSVWPIACVLACALWQLPVAQAQNQSGWTELNREFQVRNWQAVHGLPEDAITAVAQGAGGYLWAGTFNGLVRFDGTSFTVLDTSTTPELPNSSVVNLNVDQSQRLWVSTFQGLAILDKGHWTRLSSGPVSQRHLVRTFSERARIVLMTTFDGHLQWSDGQVLVPLPDPPGKAGSGYFGHVDANGTIWAGQSGFFGHWDGHQWIHSPLEQTVTNGFNGLGSARDGSAIVVRDGEMLWCQKDRILRRVPVADLGGGTWNVYEDTKGRVWVGTEINGLFVVRPDGTSQHFTEKNGLVIDTIRDICQDAEGDIWLATIGEGLVELRPRRFQRIQLTNLEPTRRVTAFLEDGPGRMLLGTFGSGLAVLDSNGVHKVDRSTIPVGVKYTQSIARDDQGIRWTAYRSDGVWTTDASGRTQRVPFAQTGGNDVTALFHDSKGRLWIGGDDTVAMRAKGEFRVFQTPGLQLGGVVQFAEDPARGLIWAASPDGVFRFDGNTWTQLQDQGGGRLTNTLALHCETNGVLWIAGSAVPLRRLKAGRLSSITQTNGLPVNRVLGILDDGLGYWWLPSNRGIARISKAELEAAADGRQTRLSGQLFTVSDGLPSVECVAGYQSPCLRDSTGRLWFGTMKGPAFIDPWTLELNRTPPKVFIDRFRTEDQRGQQVFRRWENSTPVLVPPDQHEISISFSIPGLRSPEKVTASYRIDGRDDNWRDLGGARAVYFYPPRPGTYRVRFRAINADGFGPGEETQLSFVIQPYFWQTDGFRLISLAGLVVGVSAVAVRLGRRRLRIRVLELEQRQVIERDRLRLGSILEVTTDLVAFCSPQGSLEFLNSAGRRMLGLGAKDSIASLRITTPFDDAGAQLLSTSGLPEATRTGTWTGDLHLRGASGQSVPVSLTLNVARDSEGRALWICLVARDITERKRAEDSLRRSEAEFSQLFRLCPVPIAVSSLETGILLEMNSAMEEIVGCRREDVVGRSSAELGIWNCVQAMRMQLTSPKSEGVDPESNEVRWINRRGVEVVAQYSVERIELRGVPCGLTVLSDVTERKRMEDALKANETVLRQFVQYAPAAVAMFDCDLRYLQASERWRIDFRLPHMDLTGHPSHVGFPSMPQRWKDAQERALQGIVERADEDRFVRPDGTEGWLQWEVRPWRHPRGEIGGVIMFTQWITERKETLEQVRHQLDELKRWHLLTLEREQRILQLKAEVNALSQKLGSAQPYPGPQLKAAPGTNPSA